MGKKKGAKSVGEVLEFAKNRETDAQKDTPNNAVQQRDKPKRARLTPEAKQFVFVRLAQLFPSRLIADEVADKFGIPIAPRSIRQYRQSKKGKEAIEQIRDQIDKQYAHIAAAHATHRLAVADKAIQMGLSGYKTERMDKDGLIHDVKIVDPYLALKGVEIAQKELGTQKDKSHDDAIRDSGLHFVSVVQFFEELSDDERKRLDSEWDALGFGGNGSGSRSRSRF